MLMIRKKKGHVCAIIFANSCKMIFAEELLMPNDIMNLQIRDNIYWYYYACWGVWNCRQTGVHMDSVADGKVLVYPTKESHPDYIFIDKACKLLKHMAT